MQVSVSFTVDVPATASFDEIERICVRAAREAGHRLLGTILEQRSRRRHARRKGTGRARTVLTRLGYVRFHRGRARRSDGTRYFPLDEALGLPAHHEASPSVRRRGTELAACHPYRQAAALLSAEIGTAVDHRAIWRWVQADGDRMLLERAERVNAMFTDGEAPPRPDREPPGALHLGVDGTGIRLVGGMSTSVRLAVAFAGTEPGTGARRRLVDRHVFADIAESDPFGQALAYELERTYGAHRIGRLLLLADGEPWIKHLADDWLPTARYQCDHWHLAVKIREFCSREEPRFRRMLDRAFTAPHRLAAQLRAGRWKGDPERAAELATYLDNNGDHLHTFRTMGPGRWMRGSAPAEKHIDLTVNRRFKGRGMRWSRRGARNLLAIRLEVIAKA